jgi:hypothetical protein
VVIINHKKPQKNLVFLTAFSPLFFSFFIFQPEPFPDNIPDIPDRPWNPDDEPEEDVLHIVV